jgi:oligopeptide transport system permease protein
MHLGMELKALSDETRAFARRSNEVQSTFDSTAAPQGLSRRDLSCLVLQMILRRLLLLPLTLLAIFSIAITLAWALPGNPLENPEGRQPPAEVQAAMKAQYNLDSFWRFSGSYVSSATGMAYARDAMSGKLALQREAAKQAGLPAPQRPVFDLGPSLQYRDQRVNDIVGDALPVSITLGVLAMVIAVTIGVCAGTLGAMKPGGVLDTLTLGVSLVGISVPSFVVGTVLLLVFCVWLGWFPVGSWNPPWSLFMPALTLSLPYAAYIARLTRMGMIEALGSDYVRTARAKGAPAWRVNFVHALKNAFLPVLQYLGPATAMAMTGSFVVEVVFAVPGLGQHFVNAVQNKDLFLLLGVVLVFSTMLVVMNLVVDVLSRWIDPRVE